MQAIQTKYLNPTDARGSRVRAWCQAGSLTLPWDFALDAPTNHDVAASLLAEQLGWLDNCDIEGGGLPDGRCNAYVLIPRANPYRADNAARLAAGLTRAREYAKRYTPNRRT